jgi:hypothetical protein
VCRRITSAAVVASAPRGRGGAQGHPHRGPVRQKCSIVHYAHSGRTVSHSGEMGSPLAWVGSHLGRIALTAWFGVMLALGAGLMAKHVVALPAPANAEKLAASLSAIRRPETRGSWLAVHVLYADCRCSQRVVEHLVTTERPHDWSEAVVWVGTDAPSTDLQKRFDIRRMSAEDLARFGIEAAPMLIALDPADHIRYAGGYSERKQGPVIDDLRILEDARHPEVLASLPVFGCAVSQRLRRQLAVLPTL